MNEDAVMQIKVLSYLDSRKQPFSQQSSIYCHYHWKLSKEENEMLFSHFHEYDYHKWGTQFAKEFLFYSKQASWYGSYIMILCNFGNSILQTSHHHNHQCCLKECWNILLMSSFLLLWVEPRLHLKYFSSVLPLYICSNGKWSEPFHI